MRADAAKALQALHCRTVGRLQRQRLDPPVQLLPAGELVLQERQVLTQDNMILGSELILGEQVPDPLQVARRPVAAALGKRSRACGGT